MNIVIISNYRPGNETGTAKVSENLSKLLSKENNVLYICLGKRFEIEKISKTLSFLKIPSVPAKQGYIPKITPEIVKKINGELKKFAPDIIHAQNIVFTSLVALIWAKENNTPYVITFHSLPSEGIMYVFPKLSKDKTIQTINFKITSGYVKRFLNNASAVIALNKFAAKSIKKINPKTKIVVINNAMDTKRFNKIDNTRPKGNGIKFIYPGSYMERKNQEYLVKVFHYLPETYQLDMYGNLTTNKRYVKKLNRFIKKYHLKNVNLNGFIEQKELLQKLMSSNYVVSASVKEVQSLVIVEALAAGLPIIALENETTKELINKDNGLLLKQNTSPKRFAERLIKFVNTTNRHYEEISRTCKKSVAKFDEEIVKIRIIDFYKDVIKNKNRKKLSRSVFLKQIQDIVPDKFKKLLNGRLSEELKKDRSNTLKIILSFTVVLSLIAYLVSLILNKLNSNQEES